MFQVQRLGFDGSNRKWFDVDEPLPNRQAAIRRAGLRGWGNGADHRVVDTIDGRIVWPEEE